jgi:hypothetical protein
MFGFKTSLTLAMAALSITFSPAHSSGRASQSQYPAAVQGIWMSDDDDGQRKCQNYRVAMKADRDASSFLANALIIINDKWYETQSDGTAVASTYFLERLVTAGAQRWRVQARMHIERGTDQSQRASFRMYLTRGKLTWVMETIGGTPVDSWDEHRYFRCASVPANFYAS